MKNEHISEISQTVSKMVAHPLRPLSVLRSIKMKIGFLVLGAVFTTVFVYWVGLKTGFIWPSLVGITAAIISLLLTRFFASGMTTPLREMAQVSKQMSQGDYSQRVETNSQDEIGALAVTFNKMADELSKTDEIRRELIANASHELKTPLTALQAQLENLVDGIEEPTKDKLNTLLIQTQHLSALVKQLLDLSKLESGVTQLDLEEINLESIVDNAKRVVAANNPKLKFEINTDSISLIGDYHRLVQVFTNIFSNSAKYTPEDGIISCIATHEQGSVLIQIDDNGIGIEPEIRNQIFERFARADNARNSKDGGAGIGLAITKQIVTMHGGTISATESDLGGCRIEIEIPLASASIKNRSFNGNNAIENTIDKDNNKETTSWHSIPSTTY